VCANAAWALGQMGPLTSAGVTELLRAAGPHMTVGTYLTITNVLQEGGASALAGLHAIVNDPDPQKRSFAFEAMPDTSAAIPDFLAGMKDVDPRVRFAALYRVLKVEPQTEDLRAAVRLLAQDPNGEIRQFVGMALAANPDSTRRLSHIRAAPPIANRDTTAIALGIDAELYREPSELEATQFLDDARYKLGRYFDVLVFDLVRRKGPRRIAQWDLGATDKMRTVGWDGDGIIVAHGEGDTVRAERVDPVSGAVRSFGPTTAAALVQLGHKLNNIGSGPDERLRTHIEESAGEYFLWNPRSRQKEFLFALPRSRDGAPDPDSVYSLAYREPNRHVDSIHRIWAMTTRQEPDSARFVIETFVPRPARVARPYVVTLTIEVPDTTGERDNVFGSISVPLMQKRMTLGPNATVLEFPMSYKNLRAMLAPYRRSRQVRPPTWNTAVWVNMRPVPLAADKQKLPPGILDGNAISDRTSVEVPIP